MLRGLICNLNDKLDSDTTPVLPVLLQAHFKPHLLHTNLLPGTRDIGSLSCWWWYLKQHRRGRSSYTSNYGGRPLPLGQGLSLSIVFPNLAFNFLFKKLTGVKTERINIRGTGFMSQWANLLCPFFFATCKWPWNIIKHLGSQNA